MSEMYFPYGWKLTIDNKEVEIHEVNNLVRGFFVPKGKNSFIMEFKPKDVLWGNRLSLLSLTLILLVIFNFYRKKENV